MSKQLKIFLFLIALQLCIVAIFLIRDHDFKITSFLGITGYFMIVNAFLFIIAVCSASVANKWELLIRYFNIILVGGYFTIIITIITINYINIRKDDKSDELVSNFGENNGDNIVALLKAIEPEYKNKPGYQLIFFGIKSDTVRNKPDTVFYYFQTRDTSVQIISNVYLFSNSGFYTFYNSKEIQTNRNELNRLESFISLRSFCTLHDSMDTTEFQKLIQQIGI